MTNIRKPTPAPKRLLPLTALIILALACGPLATATTASAPPPSPNIASPTPPPTANTGVLFNSAGTHAFPLQIARDQLAWTHYHWDGSDAVDIEAALTLTFDAFAQFRQTSILAPTGGIVTLANTPLGGLGYLLHGDDGRVYFMGHLSSQLVADGSRVAAGAVLGQIGNSGRWTQYIEPHLHLAIATADTDLLNQPANINAAEWLQAEFGLPWQDWPAVSVGYAVPSAWPLDGATVLHDYAALAAETPDLAGVELTGTGRQVVSALSGQVNVHRATILGQRVQIHNPASTYTVVLSGLDTLAVQDGDIVWAGDPLGTLAVGWPLHVMVFFEGQLIDPLAVLPLPAGVAP